MLINKFLALAAAASLLMLCSCSETQKLADNLTGVWSGAPEHITVKNAATANMIPTYEFERSGKDLGGSVNLTLSLNVTLPVDDSRKFENSYSVSASGVATVSGSWVVTSDDEVSFAWNNNTLAVMVDPEEVTLSSDVLTGAPSTELDSIKPAMADWLKNQLLSAVSARILDIRRFDDISFVKPDMMKYELDDRDYLMKRQQ